MPVGESKVMRCCPCTRGMGKGVISPSKGERVTCVGWGPLVTVAWSSSPEERGSESGDRRGASLPGRASGGGGKPPSAPRLRFRSRRRARGPLEGSSLPSSGPGARSASGGPRRPPVPLELVRTDRPTPVSGLVSDSGQLLRGEGVGEEEVEEEEVEVVEEVREDRDGVDGGDGEPESGGAPPTDWHSPSGSLLLGSRCHGRSMERPLPGCSQVPT
ncbi:hypothetical protein chiPu_0027409, partial [Chiloscyllium punctatum]|nr:hypothetical protein [Chiloscyllium punctatum]